MTLISAASLLLFLEVAPSGPQTPPSAQHAASSDPAAAAALPERGVAGPLPLAPRPTGKWFARADRHQFPFALADVEASMHYMRGYVAPAVPFTEEASGAWTPCGKHVFWDVGFGEEFFLLGLDNADDGVAMPIAAPPAGFSVFVDADVHTLLDFSAASSAVIDTDFRLGGGVMGRGVPWLTGRGERLSHLTWKLKFFHESTHLGDEFVKSAVTHYPTTFKRVNVSYEALDVAMGLDHHGSSRWFRYGRVHLAYRHLFNSDGPYDLDPVEGVTRASPRRELRAGLDYRRDPLGHLPKLCQYLLGKLLCPDSMVAGAELVLRQQYDFTGELAAPRSASVHVLLGAEFGRVMQDEALVRAFIDLHHGLNPHGQFRAERLTYVGLGVAMDL